MLPEVKRKLTSLGKHEVFQKVFQKLVTGEELTFKERSYILSISILFFEEYLRDMRYLSFADLSYYIILQYSIQYKDYQPLFDFSINFGFYPIAKSILNENLIKDSLSNKILESRLEDYYKNNYTQTLEQSIISREFFDDDSKEKCYLAPTSFGKSSIIIDFIKSLDYQKLKVAIIVPSKSLLIQTFKMIKDAELKTKILIHDEMYNSEASFIAIFTQERALRLLNKNNIYYDVLIIDEAHNLLKKDVNLNRNILLARLITKNKYRNEKNKIIYLSPLINEPEKLRVNVNQKITSHNIKFNIKEPRIYEYRPDNNIYQFDRFLNRFYEINSGINLVNYVKLNSKNKNFIYERSPLKIEKLAQFFCENVINPFENKKEISKVISILKKEVHEDFYAIEYLNFGVIYLHGQIPDIIKEYLEEKFTTIDEIKFLIANTVVLEGINMPIDSLFIFNTYGLKGKELINLIGRVNRLNTIFKGDKTEFDKLMPQIHFINTENNKNLHTNKIKQLRSRIFKDEVENPLLVNFDIKNLKPNKENKDLINKKIEDIKEKEKFLYRTPSSIYEKAKQSFIEANIDTYYSNLEILTLQFLKKRDQKLSNIDNEWKELKILDKLKYLFIDGLDVVDYELSRLENVKARNYYDNYIFVTRKKTFKKRVESQVEYFDEKGASEDINDRLFYIGETYGTTKKYSKKYKETQKNVFVDLGKENKKSKVNLAIVKLKMEDDFINFKLNKFFTIMYDYDLISKDEYNEVIYGTTNSHKIALTKLGLNINIVNKLETDNQLVNITFDSYNNLRINKYFNNYLNTLNDFQRFELSKYIF